MIPLPIETPRLVVREWDDGDIEPLTAMFGDEDVMRYIPVRDKTIIDMLARYRAHYAETGLSFWALCERTGAVVGEVGFHWSAEESCPEVGWLLARAAWGRGYATEATRACIDALFAHTPHDRIVAQVDERNERSLRTAERIGLTPVGKRDGHVVFEVRRP